MEFISADIDVPVDNPWLAVNVRRLRYHRVVTRVNHRRASRRTKIVIQSADQSVDSRWIDKQRIDASIAVAAQQPGPALDARVVDRYSATPDLYLLLRLTSRDVPPEHAVRHRCARRPSVDYRRSRIVGRGVGTQRTVYHRGIDVSAVIDPCSGDCAGISTIHAVDQRDVAGVVRDSSAEPSRVSQE